MAAISTPQNRSVHADTEPRRRRLHAPVARLPVGSGTVSTADEGADEGVRFFRGLLVGLGLSGVLYAGLGALLWWVLH